MRKNASEAQLTLPTQKREITGKKVKQLRRQGIIPSNVFGPSFTSQSLSINLKEFINVYKVAHETGIIYLTIGTEEVPTLVKHVQHHPLTHDILHIYFRKVDLKKKIETVVPIEVTGESIAITQLGGVLLKQHDHLTIEALPQDIPSSISVDISTITELGKEIKVSDLIKTASYEIKDDPETVVISIIAHKEESVTPETTTETPEVITAAEGDETTETTESQPSDKQEEAKKES